MLSDVLWFRHKETFTFFILNDEKNTLIKIYGWAATQTRDRQLIEKAIYHQVMMTILILYSNSIIYYVITFFCIQIVQAVSEPKFYKFFLPYFLIYYELYLFVIMIFNYGN